MTWIILLFSIGILLIAVEVVVPGAILGAIGGVMIFAGMIVAFNLYGISGGLIALVAGLAVGSLALYFEFKILPRTELGRRAFLTKEITSVTRAVGLEARDLIGKSAEAITMLSPTGYVRVDGQRYEAFCQTGQAPAGANLEVIGADNFRLIVTQNSSLS
jgi:membrane-bound ClpP family serine protease